MDQTLFFTLRSLFMSAVDEVLSLRRRSSSDWVSVNVRRTSVSSAFSWSTLPSSLSYSCHTM